MKLYQITEARLKTTRNREIKSSFVLYDAAKKSYIDMNVNAVSGISHRSDVTRVRWFRTPEDAMESLYEWRNQVLDTLEKGTLEGSYSWEVGRRTIRNLTKREITTIKRRLKIYDSVQVAEIKILI